MIIKKPPTQPAKQASQPHTDESPDRRGQPDTHESPYQGSLSPQDFISGRVPDRRQANRRGIEFRRVEDQELISRAQEEANAIRERAAEDGFQQGLAKSNETLEYLRKTLDTLMGDREEALLSVADDLAAMAVEIAERIVKTEVSCDDTLVMTLVRNTLAKVGRDQKSILIKVNPVDVKMVKDKLKTESLTSASVELIVMEDPSVDAGSCMVETQSGLIDARFSTQFELFKRILATGANH